MAKKKSSAKKKGVKKASKKTARKTAKRAVKKAVRKIIKKSSAKKKTAAVKPKKIAPAKPIGVVTHFFTHIKVGIAKFKVDVKAGSKVRFQGATTNFVQKLDSLQFNHQPVKIAKKGKQIGIKVAKRVRPGDQIFIEK